MKEKNGGGRVKRIETIAVCIGLLLVLILNIVCSAYSTVITQFFDKPNIDKKETEAATAVAHDVAQRISEEGIVMLKNDNHALPLSMDTEKENHVNVFGVASMDPFYTPNSSAAGNKMDAVNVPDGLANAGITINPDLFQLYYDSEYKNESSILFGQFKIDWRKKQLPLNEYPADIWEKTQNYSDVAIIFLSRYGSEGMNDVPQSMEEYGGEVGEKYLELSQTEKDLLEKVKSLGFKKNIVVLNTGNPMELGFTDESWIDAVLWIGYGGQDGMNALGRILSGEVNPSGHLTDTYAYDSNSSPAMQHFGAYTYTNVETPDKWLMTGDISPYYYLDYSEGIYIGYRYYETRFVDNETGMVDEEAYHKAVQYPFGHGLSYTTFQQILNHVSVEGNQIDVQVTVKNTGNCAGKDVVQVYYTPPYYVGGIEKSHVNLIGYEKTELLSPGESEEVHISFSIEDMASFDYVNKGCYVLDQGDYQIKIMKNAHDMIDSKTINIPQTIVYDEDNKRESDNVAAVSQFDFAQGDQTFLSRADWEGTWPQDEPRTREASQEIIDELMNFDYYDDSTAEDIIFKDNGLKLEDMKGLSYDDPQWELLLEQLSVEEMQDTIGNAGYQTDGIKSVGKPYTVDLDGPGGIHKLVNDTAYESVGYPCSTLVATTWNQVLIEEMGDAYGGELNAWKVSGIYSPAMNINRTPCNGRQPEYYSEDPVITGKTAAAYIRGVQSRGAYCYMKHLGLYEQTVGTQVMCTWINEQALREIYLKGFEIATKEANPHAAMACYNKIGAVWSGACSPLLNTVLRDEWGFVGFVSSDGLHGLNYDFNADQNLGIRNGLDTILNNVNGNKPEDTGPIARQNMRRAMHNLLYTVVNSNAMEIGEYGPSNAWKIGLYAFDILVVAGTVYFFWRKYRKLNR